MVLAYSLMPVLDVQASRLKTAAPFRMTWLSTPAPPERFDALGRRFSSEGELLCRHWTLRENHLSMHII